MNNYRESFRAANENVKKKLSCCQGLSRKWVLFMNGIVGLGGLVLLIVSIFNGITSGDVLAAIGTAGIVGPIIAGVILVVTSLIGCCGVIYRNKFLLLLYILVSAAAAAGFLGVGILLSFLVDDLGNVDGANSNDLAGKVEGQLNDFLIAVFNECCAKAFNLDKLLACDDAEANQEACFTFIDDYEAALNRVRQVGLCNTLENVDVDGFPVVGDPAVGGCAGGDGVLFKAVFTDLAEQSLVPIGGVFIGFGALILVTLIASCVILCANQEEYFQTEEVKANDLYAGNGTASLPAPNTYNVMEDNKFNGSGGMSNPKYRQPYASDKLGF